MSANPSENEVRGRMVSLAASLFNRGYAVGSAGNLSARLSDGNILVTPTNSSMRELNPQTLSKMTPDGKPISGAPPSKEYPLHLAAYKKNPDCGAVAHLHSTYCTALSCLDGLDRNDVIRPFTPYFVMRVGKLALLPYFKPGSADLAAAFEERAGTSRAFLLANHGSIALGRDIADAINNAEELEETAKLFFILRQCDVRHLLREEIEELLP